MFFKKTIVSIYGEMFVGFTKYIKYIPCFLLGRNDSFSYDANAGIIFWNIPKIHKFSLYEAQYLFTSARAEIYEIESA